MKSVPPSDDSALRDELRALRVDPPGESEFAASLHRKLAQASPPAPLSRWQRLLVAWREQRAWVPVSTLAGLVTVAAIGAVMLPRASEPVTAVPATKVAVVRVDLTTNVAVADADIRVSLPDGLVFWTDDGPLPQRTFTWKQPLRAGSNEIPIAVRGQRPGRYRVSVSAWIGDARVEHEVTLEVTEG